jgi:hypothetical protein
MNLGAYTLTDVMYVFIKSAFLIFEQIFNNHFIIP